MWEIIGTALLSGSAGVVLGAWWIVKYVPARGVDLDDEDWVPDTHLAAHDPLLSPERISRVFDVPAELLTSREPVTHLIVGGHTGCCRRRTDALPWTDLLTADPELVTCTTFAPTAAANYWTFSEHSDGSAHVWKFTGADAVVARWTCTACGELTEMRTF